MPIDVEMPNTSIQYEPLDDEIPHNAQQCTTDAQTALNDKSKSSYMYRSVMEALALQAASPLQAVSTT